MPVIVKLPSGGITKCKQISNLQAKVGSAVAGYVKLIWTNPSDPKFKGLEIFYKEGSEPTQHGDGTKCYDSNDGLVATTKEITGLADGRTYYFRAFAYTYKNATRVYTEIKDGAIISATPQQLKGKVVITSSQTWTVPEGVEFIDVFLVGAGGGAKVNYNEVLSNQGGGGGGYTKTIKNIAVNPGSKHSVTIGAGVVGEAGGTTRFDNHSANGGATAFRPNHGGKGGSAGGMNGWIDNAEQGASDGRSCGNTPGQGSTTKEFGENNGTLYSGGGGGGATGSDSSSWITVYPAKGGAGGGGKGGSRVEKSGWGSRCTKGVDGTPGTGGGGGGCVAEGELSASSYHTQGGSGVCIIRWGY